MTIAKQYTKELRQQTNYSATWLPQVPVALGDIGRLDNYQWTRVSTLQAKNIPFDADEGPATDISYASRGSVKASGDASGATSGASTAIGQVSAKLHLEFKREGSLVFEVTGSRSRRIIDIESVGRKIVDRFHDGQWEEDLVVVTEVIIAGSAAILVASSAGASIDLSASGNAVPSLGNLAKLGASLHHSAQHDIGVQIIGSTNLTPLFRSARVNTSLFGPTTFRSKAISAEASLVPADYSDFEEKEPKEG